MLLISGDTYYKFIQPTSKKTGWTRPLGQPPSAMSFGILTLAADASVDAVGSVVVPVAAAGADLRREGAVEGVAVVVAAVGL